jgi:hypothetical protein
MNPKPARSRARRGRPTPHSDTTPTAFVIMPFDPEFNDAFEQLLKPPLEAAGFRVERADTSLDQENILKRIVRGISDSQVVLADLTTRNPNVLYELGMAHGLNKPTILVAQSIDEIPFDLRSYRVKTYSFDFREVEPFKNWLRELGEKLLAREIRFDNPVSDFLPRMAPPAARELAKPAAPPEVMEAAPAEADIAEAGFLDWWADAVEGSKEAVGSLLKMNEAMKHMAKRVAARTEEMKAAQATADPGTASRLRMVVAATAQDILNFVKVAQRELPAYRASWERFAESVASLLRSPLVREPQHRQSVSELRVPVAAALQSADGAIAALDRLQHSMRSLRGISRDLNFAADRLLATIAEIRTEFQTSRASCVKILGLLDEILQESAP